MVAHVVAVGNAEVGIEALPRRQELPVVSEMPLAYDGGSVALLLEQFGEGNFVRMQTRVRVRETGHGAQDPPARDGSP